jgi:ADP-heptose:LPS heptosyltransferase
MTEAGGQQQLLVIRDSALGDLVTALPALRALRRAFPDHELLMTCPNALQPLAEWLGVADVLLGEDPAVQEVDAAAHPVADDLILTRGLWRGLQPSVVAVLRVPEDPGLAKELLAAKPRLYIGYAVPDVDETRMLPEFTFDEHILRRWSRLLEHFGIIANSGDFYLDEFLRERKRDNCGMPPTVEGATVVHVGAASPARHWPSRRWADIALRLHQRGHQVIFTGSPAEAGMARLVAARAGLPADRVLAGRTDIMTLAAHVARSRLVLSTDTGPAHLAAAFRVPSVTLFGPVPPYWWGPPPDADCNLCLWHGRYGDPYGSAPDPGLLDISAAEVLDAIDRLEQD